jgi:hypothetical protein
VNTLAQAGVAQGADGTPPTTSLVRGSQADKTGLYALEDVDLGARAALVLAVGLSACALTACRQSQRLAVERLVVANTPASARLAAAGVTRREDRATRAVLARYTAPGDGRAAGGEMTWPGDQRSRSR